MSRVGVRNAIASYLNAAEVDYVGVVNAERNYINEQDYEQRILNDEITPVSSSTGSGCVLIVNITADRRKRMTLTGRGSVNDMNIHSVALELWFKNTAGDPVGGQQDYDSIVDGIFEAIRADPTLGTGGQSPGSIWQAGETEVGIDHHQTAARTPATGMGLLITGAVLFEAWEQIVGVGV